ncbi:MAG: hypothetical protein N2037_01715 [Acidimicrobiales bacterium]|nr:hypothetical protein [Acidimicrobiales bacterium]
MSSSGQDDLNNVRDSAGWSDHEQRFVALSAELADTVVAALPGWVLASVRRVLTAYRGAADGSVLEDARVAGRVAADHIGGEVRQLLAADLDEQRTNPLAVVRRAVIYPTAVLRAAGVPPVVRDAEAVRLFPDDEYDLTPARFADLGSDEEGGVTPERLAQLGIEWGAAKAFVHRARHRGGAQF